MTPKTLMFIENVGSPAVCEKKIVLWLKAKVIKRVGCEAPLSLVL